MPCRSRSPGPRVRSAVLFSFPVTLRPSSNDAGYPDLPGPRPCGSPQRRHCALLCGRPPRGGTHAALIDADAHVGRAGGGLPAEMWEGQAAILLLRLAWRAVLAGPRPRDRRRPDRGAAEAPATEASRPSLGKAAACRARHPGAEASRSLVSSKLYEASAQTSNPWLFEPHHPTCCPPPAPKPAGAQGQAGGCRPGCGPGCGRPGGCSHGGGG